MAVSEIAVKSTPLFFQTQMSPLARIWMTHGPVISVAIVF
jgi:hypothetical protein